MKLNGRLPRILLATAIAGVILWSLLNRDQYDPTSLNPWLSSFGIWAPFIYVMLFATGTVAFLPRLFSRLKRPDTSLI